VVQELGSRPRPAGLPALHMCLSKIEAETRVALLSPADGAVCWLIVPGFERAGIHDAQLFAECTEGSLIKDCTMSAHNMCLERTLIIYIYYYTLRLEQLYRVMPI
jgi:hypothetical protein